MGKSSIYTSTQTLKGTPDDEALSVDELETLPAGTMPRISHHGSPGGERRGKSLVV